MINLNANAGLCMFASSKAELIKYLDVPNSHNLDPQSKQSQIKYEKLKTLTTQLLSINNYKELKTVFTSTGTEANCLAIKSVVSFYSCQTCDLPDTLHIISTEYEHKSVMSCLGQLQHDQSPYKRKIQVSYVKPNSAGQIQANDVLSLIQENTILISIMAINNELGIDNRKELIEIGKGIQAVNKRIPILFHSDCVQAFGKYNIPFDQAGLDMITLSYYKVFGPNRIGALVVGKNAQDIIMQHPLINTSLLESDSTHGGTQSMSLVAAALNSLKVVSINRQNKNKRLTSLRTYLQQQLESNFTVTEYHIISNKWEQIVSNQKGKWLLVSFSPISYSIPNTMMFTLIRYIKGKLDAPCGFKLLKHFADNGIIVATGSACGQSDIKTGNQILSAIGVPDKLQQSAIRVSFSDVTIKNELDTFVYCLCDYLQNHYTY